MKYQADISFTPNSLVYGDCLEVLRQWADEGRRVDLIYLDPPFNSNVNYHVIYDKDRSPDSKINAPSHKAFDDMWDWHAGESADRIARLKRIAANRNLAKTCEGLQTILGECGMLAYVTYMAERLYYAHRVLKPTGSIYLHCDPTASYYLRIVLNAVFGADNYRNEIVWCYSKWSNAAKFFQRNHDTILVYGKTENVTFNKLYGEMTAGMKQIRKQGYNGGSNKGKKILRVYDRTKPGAIKHINSGKYDEIYYLDDAKDGAPLADYWTDIKALKSNSKESYKYPTQKPLKLLRRIIAASSNPGDIVLDPFCGCGTAAHASFDMQDANGNKLPARKFIGIDISPYAINQVCKRRLKRVRGLTVQGIPGSVDELAELYNKKPFDFEKIAVTSLPGVAPNDKQTGDGGVDGWAKLLNENPVTVNGQKLPLDCIAQVKMGKPSVDSIRAFASKLIGGSAAIGVFITLHKQKLTPTMRDEIKRVGKMKFEGGAKEYDRLVFWSMEEYYNDEFPVLPEFTEPYTGQAMHEFIRPD